MIDFQADAKLNILNHSCAHLLAQAVRHLYPKALFWVGPVIRTGFYYDIDLGNEVIKPEDLVQIEAEMHRIVATEVPIEREEITRADAKQKFKNDPYKLDLIERMESDAVITCYTQGDFTDLCRGPHITNVRELKHFKLLKVSGAYWKGDSNQKMLQRIYGVCFSNASDLNQYLTWLAEAERRDHKKIGKELGLFMVSDYGPGFPFFLPKGMVLRNILEDFWYAEHRREGYEFIKTPTMLNKSLWELSGHWDNYRENMYVSEIDGQEYAIKPMNCPGGMLVYKSTLHSYRDLPLRIGELGLVHRHEASGALNGLFRVRAFTQDDAHIFMTEDQIESEVIKLINFIDRIYKVFGLTYEIELSTRPKEKFIGEIKVWDKSEKALEDACQKSGHQYKLNPGDGAFYGPKLDFHIKDATLGRVWQCGTIQLDFNLPERFDLTYIAPDGSQRRPVMLHRVIYGSLERFIGILIEHYAGAFPLWLAPIQVNIIPINNSFHLAWAQKIKSQLEALDFRVKLDNRAEKLGYRMHDSITAKIPITVIIGQKEVTNQELSYRKLGETTTQTVSLSDFKKELKTRLKAKN